MELDESLQELKSLRSKVVTLETESKFLRGQLLQLYEAFERQEQLLRSQQATVSRVDRIQMEMLTGRLWRGLRAASDLAKRFVPGKLLGGGGMSIARSDIRSHLVCDEPIAGSIEPRSGLITVRGWCLAEGGVDSVRISVSGLEPFEVQPNIPRPDVKKSYADLDATGRSGFLTEFDSSKLANGTYLVKVQVISNGVAVRDELTSVIIDHERGFSTEYDRWIHQFEKSDDALIALRLGMFQIAPSFSILMPVFNTEAAELEAAIDSVIAQSYGKWELCIADDGSSKPHVREILQRFAAKDDRIKVVHRELQGGISAACNSAWQTAGGEYITFLDHDDTLSPHALAHVVQHLDTHAGVDLIYSDEDKLDSRGRRFDPFFKPDWSPDLLLSENYLCHLLVLRSDLAQKVGGFRSDCDGSQDYDLILHATSKAQKIGHVPRVLYHWRAGVASTATTIENKTYAVDAAKKALQRFCSEEDPHCRVEEAGIIGRWRIRYPIPEGTSVSIIIASGGKEQILRNNIDSVFEKTKFRDFEIVVIDNSKADVIQSLVSSYASAPRTVRYIDHRNQPFNYSAINNRAARTCNAPLLLFLNDDTSVISEDWLDALVEQVSRPEVGAAGAKLLYPEGKIQHGGVIMGLYDNCGHAFKGMDGNVGHYFDFSDVIRNVSAVTGACLMAKKDIFWTVGGFDEIDFAVAFNDIDLCLKIGSAGYRIIYTPHALLTHYEAFSKTSKDLIPHPEEVLKMRIKWGSLIKQDPFYSPNLTRNEEDYRLRS